MYYFFLNTIFYSLELKTSFETTTSNFHYFSINQDPFLFICYCFLFKQNQLKLQDL